VGGVFWSWYYSNSNSKDDQIPYGGKAKLGVYYRYSGMRERLLAAFPAAFTMLVFVLVVYWYNVVGYNDHKEDEGEGEGEGEDDNENENENERV
jgi:hypothetical protein